jgi:hypothetical protein
MLAVYHHITTCYHVRTLNRFCEDCYEKYKEKHKLSDKRERILVAGQGVVKQTLEHGDETHYPDVQGRVLPVARG